MATKKSKAEQLLAFAKDQAKRSKRWTDLHNAVFGIGGKLMELFPTAPERLEFSRTPEADEVAGLIESLQNNGEAPVEAAGGSFLLRVPVSLHAALKAEAEREGVSLNQLCVAKLSAQLAAVVHV